MPEPSGWVELEAAAILLGVDHEDPTGADGQVVEVGRAAGAAANGQEAFPSVAAREVDLGGCDTGSGLGVAPGSAARAVGHSRNAGGATSASVIHSVGKQ